MNLEDLFCTLVIGALFAGLGFSMGIVIGKDQGRETAQEEAIKANAAEWGSDENGQPVFKWKN